MLPNFGAASKQKIASVQLALGGVANNQHIDTGRNDEIIASDCQMVGFEICEAGDGTL